MNQSQKFKPVNEELKQLESLLNPQQKAQASELSSELLTDMIRTNFNLLSKENLELKQANKTLLSNFSDLQRKDSQSPERQNSAESVPQDTLIKMEKLVKLNTELMSLNNNLHEDVKQLNIQNKTSETKLLMVQKDLSFYINTNSSLLQTIETQNK